MAEPGENIVINFEGGESVVLTRENTALYTFWGGLSIYDHVFLEMPSDPEDSPEDDGMLSCYIFRHEQGYEELVDIVRSYEFPQFLNLNEVSEGDAEAFYQKQIALLEDGLGNAASGE